MLDISIRADDLYRFYAEFTYLILSKNFNSCRRLECAYMKSGNIMLRDGQV